MDTPDDYGRYKLKIDGLVETTTKDHTYEFEGLSSTGEIRIQLYIDNNEIPNMVHTIKVLSPPCPDVIYQRIGKSSELNIIVNAYGAGNRIKKVHVVKGAKTKKSSKAEKKEHEQGYTYKRKIFLKEGGGVIELEIFTNNDYFPTQLSDLPNALTVNNVPVDFALNTDGLQQLENRIDNPSDNR